MGEWENGRMGEWENGRMGEWERVWREGEKEREGGLHIDAREMHEEDGYVKDGYVPKYVKKH